MSNQPALRPLSLFAFLCLFIAVESLAQSSKTIIEQAVKGISMRAVGPAVMGGRIADIAVSPDNPNTWYVAAGSGGVWKTTNRGISWQAVFENQPSYSIGAVSIDPNNSQVIWVGTGENVSGRHVGWGDGVYRSLDGGNSWQSMGLSRSEHIGKIAIDPRNSNLIYVAAEGPLWASGGERGLYRSEDGGQSWDLVLKIDENTGVTDIEFDPSNPDVLYAASYQRRRHTWSLLSGGPASGIYKSSDQGNSWKRLQTGLPKGDMGKIGLAVTPADPNLVYATIEADDAEKGFYRSSDKGESWEKQNSYISGGTGPHYYQEIEASPTNPDLVYQMDVFLHVTRDGGKTIDYLGTGREKHSDNHALWIDPADGSHLLAGTDAGLYETFDEGTTWRHFPNLPISQFYKLALDNTQPFYNIVGGAQDLGTLIGPSATTNTEGVRNQDWYVPLGADGYDTAADPEDPDIIYMEIQEGQLHRYHKSNEEVLNIQPKPGPNDPPERWNWDSPILISPHNHKRLYYGSQRLWRSDDQGNSWTPVSGDLTTNTNRYELEMIGRVWSVDALYDNGAMSKYATLTNISESVLEEGLLYTGSDDGLIYISEDGGQNWRKSGALPQVPNRSFINDVEASLHNSGVVFAAADAHKLGDFKPYLFMSSDRGRSWKSITGDLPTKTIVWSVKQDHLNPDLLFIGTEYGIYFSLNKGQNWIQLIAGLPTIPFRDIELHPRDNDLVGASFGRGFFILDDYSPLRTLAGMPQAGKNTLFPVRDAWWYIPNAPMQAKGMPTLGSTSYVADNPPYGALISFFLQDIPQTAKTKRQQNEKTLRKEWKDIPFPGWENLLEENKDEAAVALVLIRNEANEPVRWLKAPASKGMHRINWDLRYAAPDPIDLTQPGFVPPWAGEEQGPLAAPGNYSAELFVMFSGTLEPQGPPQKFEVKPIPALLGSADFSQVAAFQQQTSELSRQLTSANRQLREAGERMRYMKAALTQTAKAGPDFFNRLKSLEDNRADLQTDLSGNRAQQRLNENSPPSLQAMVGSVIYGHWETTRTPTETQKQSIARAGEAFSVFQPKIRSFLDALQQLESDMEKAGAPYTPGRRF
jgi:photosystem II stability/assembly factor-like uncharacterized protein